ncbi:MAG TPA: hemagglutinin repeat-containing protein [Holophaga sp.]|nr:hemagglutinin repeat-containing protein [Holophaga sp.]
MNRHMFCILYSQAKGSWVVVRESARSCGTFRHGGCMNMFLRCFCALLTLQPVLLANVVPAKGAPEANRPVVETTPSQVTLVRIAAPNRAGVSDNHYDHFNVGRSGLILNNAREAFQTTLAGTVAGNPALAEGGARVILNQVLGTSPTSLCGITEVAGLRADVVIANPNGITCNGGTFLNAGRAVLSTGLPVLGSGGGLEGFRVLGGQIRIGQDGLAGGSVAQLDLLTRSLQVEGPIRVKGDLNAVIGRNQVAWPDLAVQALEDKDGRTSVGVDVGSLGGMYANRIHLIGTETGVGVNSQGTLAAQGGAFTFTTQGRIVLKGSTLASGDLTVSAGEGIQNSGSLYAQGSASLKTPEAVTNRGTLAALKNLTVGAGDIDASGILAAGVNGHCKPVAEGQLALDAKNRVTASGLVLSGGRAAVSGASLSLAGAQMRSGGDTLLAARTGDLDLHDATLKAGGAFTAQVAGTLDNRGGRVEAARLDVAATGLDNRKGALDQDGAERSSLVVKGTFANDGGRLVTSGQGAMIRASTLTNGGDGLVRHTGKGTLELGVGKLDNAGTLMALEALDLKAAQITSSGTLAAGFDGQGKPMKGGRLAAVVSGPLAAKGAVVATGDIALAASSLTLARVTTGASLTLTAQDGDLDTKGGQLHAQGALRIDVSGAWSHDGARTMADALDISAQGLSNRAGSLQQTGTRAATLVLGGPTLDNTGGRIATNGGLTLIAAGLDNSAGQVTSGGSARVELGGKLANGRGLLQAGGSLALGGTHVDNAAGRIIAAGGDLDVRAAGNLANTPGQDALGGQGGVVFGKQDVRLRVNTLTNGGVLEAGRTLALQEAEAVTNTGHIAAPALELESRTLSNRSLIQGGKLTLKTRDLDNGGGKLFQVGTGECVLSVTGTLDNRSGRIHAQSTNLRLRPRKLDNRAGTIAHGGDGLLFVNVGEGALENGGGRILGNGSMCVPAPAIHNQGGTLAARKKAIIIARRDLDNRTASGQGGFIGAEDLTIQTWAGKVHNEGGRIQGEGQLIVATQELGNAGGTLLNTGEDPLRVDGGRIADNTGGTVSGKGDVTITGARLENGRGRILAGRALSVKATAGPLDNAAGILDARGDLSLSATGTLKNPQGTIQAGGKGGSANTLDVAAQDLDNQGGRIANAGTGVTVLHAGNAIQNGAGKDGAKGILGGNGPVTLLAPVLDNRKGGEVVSGGDLDLAIQERVSNQGGTLASLGKLIVDQGDVDNAGGRISAKGDMTLNVRDLCNSQGTIGSSTGNAGDVRIRTTRELLNDKGSITSGQDLAITTRCLPKGGTLLGGRDTRLDLVDGVELKEGQKLTANRHLTLITSGKIENGGTLEAPGRITLGSASFMNHPTGLVNGQGAHVTSKGPLSNKGRIYGGDIALQAEELANDQGVVAARGALDIGVEELTNRYGKGTLYSEGDLRVGGTLDSAKRASGTCQSFLNEGGTVQSGGGNLSISSKEVENVPAAQSVSRSSNSRSLVLIQPKDGTEKYEESKLIPAKGQDDVWGCYWVPKPNASLQQVDLRRIEGNASRPSLLQRIIQHNSNPRHDLVHDYWRFDITRTIEEAVDRIQEPGRLLARKNLTFSADIVVNDRSWIIAGGMVDKGRSVFENQDGRHVVKTTDQGTSYFTNTSWKGGGIFGGGGHRNRDQEPKKPYRSISETSRYLGLCLERKGVPSTVVSVPSAPSARQSQGQGVSTPELGANRGTDAPTLQARPTVEAQARVQAKVPALEAPPALERATFSTPDLSLPTSLLYRLNQDREAPCLVETDPAFLKGMEYKGLEHMLGRLEWPSTLTRKRLGDGFFETQLVSRQTQALTNSLSLVKGCASDNQEFVALMDNGLSMAEALKLTPGSLPTDAQRKALTKDSVWMVAHPVQLPSGGSQSVLVPVLFLSPETAATARPTSGALVSGDVIVSKGGPSLKNTGTLLAKSRLAIQNDTIENKGRVETTAPDSVLALLAKHDLASEGEIRGHRVHLQSDRDLDLRSTVATDTATSGSQTHLNRVSQVTGDSLVAIAGRDLKVVAAELRTRGSASLDARRDLVLDSLATGFTEHLGEGRNRHDGSITDVRGSTVNTGGSLTMRSGRDTLANAAQVSAAASLDLEAQGRVSIRSSEAHRHVDEEHRRQVSGTLSEATYHARTVQDDRVQVASLFSGDTVNMRAHQDLTVQGSQIASTGDASLKADGAVRIQAATSTSRVSGFDHATHSGLSSSGGLGFSFGSRERKDAFEQDRTTQSQNRSLVGSTDGNLTITGRDSVRVSGSSLVAKDDLEITGGEITLDPGRDRMDRSERHLARQTGLTVSLGGGALDVAQAARAQVQSLQGPSGDGRAAALQALNTYNLAHAVGERRQALVEASRGGSSRAVAEATGIRVSASIGTSRSDGQSRETVLEHAGASAASGGNLRLTTTTGDLQVKGSTLGGQDITLDSARAIQLSSDQDASSRRAANASSSGSLGVSLGVDGNRTGLQVHAALSRGQGRSDGDISSQVNTQVAARDALTLRSAGDTSLLGATAKARQIQAQVGGNLHLESRQDTYRSASTQESEGVNVSVPIYGTGGSASYSQSRTRTRGDADSVQEQTGLFAGEGGFQLTVKSNTDLKGAVIDSRAAADKNTLSTATLTHSDIQNTSRATSDTQGTRLSTDMGSSQRQALMGAASILADQGHARKDDASTTHSAIAKGSITLTDARKQQALTGQDAQATLQGLRRETKDTHRAFAGPDVAAVEEQAQLERKLNSAAVTTLDGHLERREKRQQEERALAEASRTNVSLPEAIRRDPVVQEPVRTTEQLQQALSTAVQAGLGENKEGRTEPETERAASVIQDFDYRIVPARRQGRTLPERTAAVETDAETKAPVVHRFGQSDPKAAVEAGPEDPNAKPASLRKLEAYAPNPSKVGILGQATLVQLGVVREVGKAVIETVAGTPGDAYAVATGSTVTGDTIDRRVAAAGLALPFVPGTVKKAAKALAWTAHKGKHIASANVPWAKIVDATRSGPAKYLPGTNIEALERMIWSEGTKVEGKAWRVMEFAKDVGASRGKPSRWVRVEESAGTIHGHPITEAEFHGLSRRK